MFDRAGPEAYRRCVEQTDQPENFKDGRGLTTREDDMTRGVVVDLI